MGQCYELIGNTDAAVKVYTKIINSNRNNEEALLKRAELYQKQNKIPFSISDYNRVITINPNNHQAYTGRGKVYLNQKRYDLALSDFNESIKIKPTGEAYYFRGAVKSIKNDNKGACSDLKASAELGYEEAKIKLSELCP